MTTSTTQYLVRGADGHDYARVEPWEGGLPAAERGARRLHGYVMQLDENLCVPRGARPVADFREAGAAVPAPTVPEPSEDELLEMLRDHVMDRRGLFRDQRRLHDRAGRGVPARAPDLAPEGGVDMTTAKQNSAPHYRVILVGAGSVPEVSSPFTSLAHATSYARAGECPALIVDGSSLTPLAHVSAAGSVRPATLTEAVTT